MSGNGLLPLVKSTMANIANKLWPGKLTLSEAEDGEFSVTRAIERDGRPRRGYFACRSVP